MIYYKISPHPSLPSGPEAYGPAAKEGYKGTLVLLDPVTEKLWKNTKIRRADRGMSEKL